MDRKLGELQRRVDMENQRAKLHAPLLRLALGLALGLALSAACATLLPPAIAFKCSVAAASMAGLLALALFANCLARCRESKGASAARIDSDNEAKSRLEAYVELSVAENPLKEAQATDAQNFYSGRPVSNWTTLRVLLAALIVSLVCAEATMLHKTLLNSKKAQVAANEKAKEKKEEPKQKPPDFAELSLTAPESETRAKPIDEIIWQGAGNSSNGFESLSLELSVNGERRAPLQPDAAPLKQPADVAYEGAILLEELKVEPFDVVGYHVKGTTRLDSKNGVEIVSVPQFIEVRPFREDAKLMGGGNFPGADKLNMLIKFLKMQLALNKAVFAARASELDPGDKILKEQVSLIAQEQRELLAEVDKYLKETPADKITANEMDCLTRAISSMKDACAKLEQEPQSKNDTGKGGL